MKATQFSQTEQMLMPFFTHSFTVNFKCEFRVNNCPQIFIRLHTLNSLTFDRCVFLCLDFFPEINEQCNVV